MPRSQWDSQINDLRLDNRSGAAEIALRALDLLVDAVGDSMPAGAISYRRWLMEIGRQVMSAQPAMGVLFRLVNDMLWACDVAVSSTEMRQMALDYLQDYRMLSGAALSELTDHAVAFLSGYGTLLTYSRSSTVGQVLSGLAQKRRLHVYCSEGRPMLEGQTLASELGWAGITVTMGVDMALFGWLDKTDVLLLGADSVSRAGIVNKLGTAPLAQMAFERSIPCIAVCSSDKLLPNDYIIGQTLHAGDPDEIMPPGNNNVTVSNVYYDVTPLDYITHVITNEGVYATDEMSDRLALLKTYPGLRGGA